MNQTIQKFKNSFDYDAVSSYLYGIFLSGFYLMPNTKVQRAAFVLLVLLPFLLFSSSEILKSLKPKLMQLTFIFIALLTLSITWTQGQADLRIDKILTSILSTVIFIFISYHFFSNERWKKSITLIIISSSFALSFSLFYFYQDHSFPSDRLQNIFNDYHPVVTGHCAALSALLIMFSLDQFKLNTRAKIALSLALLCVLSATILTHSRGPMLGFVSASVILFLLKGPKYFLLFAAILISGIFLYWLMEPSLVENLVERKSAERINIYLNLIKKVEDHKFFGMGIMSNDALKMGIHRPKHAHSIFVATYFFVGFIGLMLFLSVLLMAALQGLQLFVRTKNWLPLIWLIYGTTCLAFDGSRLIRTYSMEWLLIWIPVVFIAAQHHMMKNTNINPSSQ